jgi:hypothetical protein
MSACFRQARKAFLRVKIVAAGNRTLLDNDEMVSRESSVSGVSSQKSYRNTGLFDSSEYSIYTQNSIDNHKSIHNHNNVIHVFWSKDLDVIWSKVVVTELPTLGH